MADNSTDKAAAAKAEAEAKAAPQTAPAPAVAAQPILAVTEADIARQRLQSQAKTLLDREDAKRARSGTVTMVAVTSFYLHDGEEEILIEDGQELEVNEVDVARMTGRCRLKEVRDGSEETSPLGPSVKNH
ncbi:hypothetical protein [Roseomonas sp. USHLN139]|uniref:hypothetical protein n=1 Tax=Roseomonas sp. USHLN139 TaxID=3081298 RepID=UPI003B01B317